MLSASFLDPMRMGLSTCVYTIGHSNHSIERFCELLRQHCIEVVVDVRSSPFSRYATWFNRDPLREALADANIKYLFMGDAIGGRPDSPEFYDEEDHVDYALLSESSVFRQGIDRLVSGCREYRIAIMCGEENPSECHRNLLIGRVLADRGIEVVHIRGDGHVDTASDLQDSRLTLFDQGVEAPWRSTQSVSRSERRSSSSNH